MCPVPGGLGWGCVGRVLDVNVNFVGGPRGGQVRVTVGVRLRPALRDELRGWAAADGVSLSALARELLVVGVAERRARELAEARRQRVQKGGSG